MQLRSCLSCLLGATLPVALLAAGPITVRIEEKGKPISPDLIGVFFEDLNYAADGGLYAELIQNRSFEYQATEQPTWNSLTAWELVERGKGSNGSWAVDDALPLHRNNPRYLVLHVSQPGDGVGVANGGFGGIPVQAGEIYDLSFFARQLWMTRRWGPESAIDGKPMPATVRLEAKDGEVLAEADFGISGREWTRHGAALTVSRTTADARVVLLAKAQGGLAIDMVSLFPRKTFRNRPNGQRADLAQTIADLKPRFVRFPGGCLVHGNGLGNMYRWKDTIGPVEQRRAQSNLWRYHQTVGLGYFEYFQFCEDIGAKPLPVVPAGVSCQNSGHTSGVGQQCLPLAAMPGYIQEVLDLIEYANGPATSPWGAKRAAAGHPEPFHLKYLGVGNEEHITPGFEERFRMIYEAIRAKHPEIVVIGTVGPSPDGDDYENGWRIADSLKLEMVDEHGYKPPQWFWEHLARYDAYDRSKSRVYLGEYAAHDDGRRSTLRSALAEAAYLTSLERNGDIVRFASYAPLLGRIGHTQWNPNLIYFTSTQVFPTINYHVQRLFGSNAGDRYLPSTIDHTAPVKPADFAFSAVQDSRTDDIILKLVNGGAAAKPTRVEFGGATNPGAIATKTVLTGDPMATNTRETPRAVMPETSTMTVARSFTYDAPPHSLTVIRVKTGFNPVRPASRSSTAEAGRDLDSLHRRH